MFKTVVKSELILKLAMRFPEKSFTEINDATNEILKSMISSLESGNRIEIRGFGTFNFRETKGKVGRNPKTGDPVIVEPSKKILFKCSKCILENMNQ